MHTNHELICWLNEGEDCFRIAHGTLYGQLTKIFEAWSPEHKAAIVRAMARKNFHLEDHVQIGDYDLVIWHARRLDPSFYGVDAAYFVSFNVGEHDPTTETGQSAETEHGKIPIREVAEQLKTWVARYGKIAVSSYYPQRTAQYYQILKHLLGLDLHFSWIRAGEPDYGFYVESSERANR